MNHVSNAQSRDELRKSLQNDILALQGFKPQLHDVFKDGLGPIQSSFPNSTFPLGAVHEFIAQGRENTSATTGFLAGLLKTVMGQEGAALWIAPNRDVFAPALLQFSIAPTRIIFLHLKTDKQILWAVEQALQCAALSAVIGELPELDFTASRRMQLAVERSHVTGFLLRRDPRRLSTTASVARWRVSTLPSDCEDGLPGIGFPCWNVELLKIRNGQPGRWTVTWKEGAFHVQEETKAILPERKRKMA